MHLLLPKGTKVCYEPTTGKETIIENDLYVFDARWSVNGLPGWVFNYKDGKATAYTLEFEKVIECHDSIADFIDIKE